MNPQTQIQNFKTYLLKENYSPASANSYRCIVTKFLLSCPGANNFSHKEVLAYLEELSHFKFAKNTRQAKLTALKKYYDFLIDTGLRNEHPCSSINIKGAGKKGVVFSDLFLINELESLLLREERYPHLKTKNQVIISLLIYQGLLPSEIIKLKLAHIDLEARTVFVSGGRLLNSRTLDLHPRQITLFENYLNKDRKRLSYKEKNDFFILNFQGTNEKTSDGIIYLIETLKARFPDRNLNTKAIRNSVIAYWLNEKKIPLEQVQLLAGHRWISSTLRYRQHNIELQRQLINRWFPI